MVHVVIGAGGVQTSFQILLSYTNSIRTIASHEFDKNWTNLTQPCPIRPLFKVCDRTRNGVLFLMPRMKSTQPWFLWWPWPSQRYLRLFLCIKSSSKIILARTELSTSLSKIRREVWVFQKNNFCHEKENIVYRKRHSVVIEHLCWNR